MNWSRRILKPVLLLSVLMVPITAAIAIPSPPVPPAPEGAATYSKQELEASPPEKLLPQLFSDWARDFTEARMDEGPAFYTKPTTAFPTICGVRRLQFHMVTPSTARDSKSYVAGLTIEDLYRIVDLHMPFDQSRIEQWNATSAACNALSTGTKYFPAPSGLIAGFQHHLIETAVIQARGKARLSFELSCGTKDCDARAILSALSASNIQSIETRDCPVNSRAECYEVQVGNWYLETLSRPSTHGYSLAEPGRVLVSIHLNTLPRFLRVDCQDCK